MIPNWKTIARGAKLPSSKLLFRNGTTGIINRDNHIVMWFPCEETGTIDIDDNPTEGHSNVEEMSRGLASIMQQDTSSMLRINSKYLKRAISSLDLKGDDEIFISIGDRYMKICHRNDDGESWVITAGMKQ